MGGGAIYSVRRSLMADPSSKRDSPETGILSLGGAPTSLRRALRAIGSVAERIAPKVKDNTQLNSHGIAKLIYFKACITTFC